MLELTHIQKDFGSFPVLSVPQLSITPGIHWLKGANGAGKSTLLRIIGGLLPFKGDIMLEGNINMRKDPIAYRNKVNYAEAEPAYPGFLSGTELYRFVQSVRKSDSMKDRRMMELLGIDAFADNPTGSYSSGMLKKLSLSLVFIGHPRLILLDEPLTTLDQATQQLLCELITRKHADEGISFIITSHHDIEQAAIPFDRVFTIKDKQVTENNDRP